jgi:hypothetical protein
MSIVDEGKLLTDEERKAYQQLLKLHGYAEHHFLVEVKEDQTLIDMNDINYVIILNVNVKNVRSNISNTYFSQSGSQTWISEFEHDLHKRYYTHK